jgi:hypothetical protein
MTRPSAHSDAVRVVNLTPHPVTVYSGDAVVASWPPAGPFARLAEIRDERQTLSTHAGDVPVIGITYSEEIAELPEPSRGTVYVVSRVLAAAVPRHDLFAPVDEVRDSEGQIIGCRALGTFAPNPRET